VEDIKGGGAELLEEKNQRYWSIYVSVTSFTFTSAFCISNFWFFTQFHILCGDAGFCQICNDGVEDIEHFILKCKPLDEVRQNKLEQFKRTVEDI
jgi:hypothetical protein